jgi:hypothetical protein
MMDDDRGYQVRPTTKSNLFFSPLLIFSDRSQSDSTDVSTSSRSASQARPPSPSGGSSPCPCAILQAFACYHGYGYGNASQSPAVIGDAELSQLVFMHREAFLASPSAHAGCSTSFRGLATILEKRVQLPGGAVGMDAVGMLRTEAWLLSGWSA